MDDDRRKERLNKLFLRQKNTFYDNVDLTLNMTTSNYNILADQPVFQLHDYSIKDEINAMKNLKDIEDSVFAKWLIYDIPVMVTAGGLGTLSSVFLKDFFAKLHDDKWSKKGALKGGHSGENADWVPENKQAGGFGHRWKFGHDLLYPFEIDKKQYIEIAEQSGVIIPAWLWAPFYWVRHLLQDSFSKEGLPFPGNSLLRFFLDPTQKSTREVLQFMGTIKLRDLAGASITNIVMGAYLWRTEKDIKRVICKPNYRAYSLMLGANLISLLSGLLIPPPNTSFNWGCIPIIGYYSYHLLKLEKKVREELTKREKILNQNDNIIQKNEEFLFQYSMMNDQIYKEFISYEESIIAYYAEIMRNHERVKNIIYSGGEK